MRKSFEPEESQRQISLFSPLRFGGTVVKKVSLRDLLLQLAVLHDCIGQA